MLKDDINAIIAKVRSELGLPASDVGSSYIQVAIRHTEVVYLTQNHFNMHKKDHHSFRGLQSKINAMKKHSQYLRKHDEAGYEKLRQLLGMRK